MVMSKEEIVADYRQAKTKMKQIGILAELNLCKRQDILDILIEAGEDLPKNYRRKADIPKTRGGGRSGNRSFLNAGCAA